MRTVLTSLTCVGHVLRVAVRSPRLHGAIHRVHCGRLKILQRNKENNTDYWLLIFSDISFPSVIFNLYSQRTTWYSRKRTKQKAIFVCNWPYVIHFAHYTDEDTEKQRGDTTWLMSTQAFCLSVQNQTHYPTDDSASSILCDIGQVTSPYWTPMSWCKIN